MLLQFLIVEIELRCWISIEKMQEIALVLIMSMAMAFTMGA